MKEELLRRQTLDEGGLNKSTSLCPVVILLVVRQRAIGEAIRNTTALRGLLPYTCHHLGNVNRGALGARLYHRNQTVLDRQRSKTRLTCLLCRLVQRSNHTALELLLVRLSRVIIKEIQVNLKTDILNLLSLLLNLDFDFLLRLLIGYQVTDTNRETIIDEKLLNSVLERVNHINRVLRAIIVVGNMNNALRRLRKDRLIKDTLADRTLLDLHEILRDLVILIRIVRHVHVDRRHELGNHLLTRPLAILLRPRNVTLKPLIPHHQIHILFPIELHRGSRNAIRAYKSILNNTNNRLAVSRRDDLERNRGDFCEFRRRLITLRNVGIHFITIEICVIRGGYRYIQTECIERKNLTAVSHHRHAVKRRLSVKQDNVAVSQVTVNCIAEVKNNLLAIHML